MMKFYRFTKTLFSEWTRLLKKDDKDNKFVIYAKGDLVYVISHRMNNKIRVKENMFYQTFNLTIHPMTF